MTMSSSLWSDASAAAEAMVGWYRRHRPRPDFGEQQWDEVTTVLAVSLCRIAEDQTAQISEANLHGGHVFAYLRFVERLLERPLPADMDRPMPLLSGDVDPVLRCADNVMGANVLHYSEGNELGPTDDLMLDTETPAIERRARQPAFTIGHRLQELAQDAQTLPPLAESDQLQDCARAMASALHRRDWVPTTDDVRLAQAALIAIRIHPDEPLAEAFDASWLARLRRMAHVGDTGRGLNLNGVAPVLAHVVSATVDLAEATTPPLAQLNDAWSARPEHQRLAHWERTNVPIALRRRIRATEHDLFVTATVLTACVTGDVDY